MASDFVLPDLNVPAKQRRLKNSEKKQIAHLLSVYDCNNKLKRGALNKLSFDHGVSKTTISKIWKVVHKAIKEGNLPNVDRKYKGGHKRYALDLEKVRHIPLHLRCNIRTLAQQLNASKSTVHRLVQKGNIRPHSNALKPFLTPSNMEARVKFVLKHIENSTLHTNPTYVAMFLIVHIDEKWFYMTRQTQKYYLLPGESEPHRKCKSKRFITKVILMSAVARPQYNGDGVSVGLCFWACRLLPDSSLVPAAAVIFPARWPACAYYLCAFQLRSSYALCVCKYNMYTL
ncbi:uncharacterized protein LOC141711697 [Apium graveolens]|uniref:uncharacterized protein LOC141711697 n=1 Tax=Apium graveolens TaxID=4045 RepID=UPI003D797E87